MGDKAETAVITLHVSDDGSAINPGIGSPIPCGTWDWSASQE
jgi:hypothetical protein